MSNLTLEIKRQEPGGIYAGGAIQVTPDLDEDYWTYRVQVGDNALVGFPKFGTIGIGFAREDKDWNTNLPYRVKAERIAQHIDANRPKGLRRAVVIEAVKLIQAQAHADLGTDPTDEVD